VAKVIKTNIVIDGQRCRSIEDVQENFNLLDVLEQLESGRLVKWAKSRNFKALSEQLETIRETESGELAKQVCKVFGVQFGSEEIAHELALIEISKDLLARKNERNTALEYKQKLDSKAQLHGKNDVEQLAEVMSYIANLDRNNGYKPEDGDEGFDKRANINEVYTYIAEHELTPPDVLKELAFKFNEEIKFSVINNPNTPESAFKYLAEDPGSTRIIEYLSFSKYTPDSVRKTLISGYCPSDFPDYVDYFSEEVNACATESAAYSVYTPTNLLIEFASSDEIGVRSALAKNPVTPKDILEILTNDNDPWVSEPAKLAILVPSLNTKELDKTCNKIIRDGEYGLEGVIAYSPNVSVKVLDKLANNETEIRAISLNPNTSLSTLNKISNDGFGLYKKYANQNIRNRTQKVVSN